MKKSINQKEEEIKRPKTDIFYFVQIKIRKNKK